MLVVKIELHSAITGKITTIGRMVIDNIGGTRTRGDYRVRLLRANAKEWLGMYSIRHAKVTREGRVLNYPRLSYSVWRLVFRSLKAILKEEK